MADFLKNFGNFKNYNDYMKSQYKFKTESEIRAENEKRIQAENEKRKKEKQEADEVLKKEKDNKLKEEITNYIDAVGELKDYYKFVNQYYDDKIDKINKDIAGTPGDNIYVNYELQLKKKKIEKERDNFMKKNISKIVSKLRTINNSLSSDAKIDLKRNNLYCPGLASLKESYDFVNLKSVELTSIEEKLIFGDGFKNISDVLSLEEAIVDPLTGEKEQNDLSAATKLNNAQKSVNSAVEKLNDSQNKDIPTKIAAKNNLTQAKLTQIKVNQKVGGITEASNQIDNAIKNANLRIDNLEKRKEDTVNRFNNQIERLKDQKENLSTAKKVAEINANKELTEANIVATSSNGKKVITNTEIDNEKEVVEEAAPINNKYAEILFNGDAGEVLKYLITGTSEDQKVVSMATAMSTDEVNVIIKKIKFYLNKKEPSYEDYIELKVLKDKFKKIYNLNKNIK